MSTTDRFGARLLLLMLMVVVWSGCAAEPSDPPPPSLVPVLPHGFDFVDPDHVVESVRPVVPRSGSGELEVVDTARNGFDYLVSWAGRPCNTATRLTFHQRDGQIEIALHQRFPDDEVCADVAELYTVVVSFREPTRLADLSVQSPDPRTRPGTDKGRHHQSEFAQPIGDDDAPSTWSES